MDWLQIVTAIFNIIWLIALITLLYLIWRSSEARLKHVITMEKTLVDVATKNAESAKKAVETASDLTAMLKAQSHDSQLF